MLSTDGHVVTGRFTFTAGARERRWRGSRRPPPGGCPRPARASRSGGVAWTAPRAARGAARREPDAAAGWRCAWWRLAAAAAAVAQVATLVVALTRSRDAHGGWPVARSSRRLRAAPPSCAWRLAPRRGLRWPCTLAQGPAGRSAWRALELGGAGAGRGLRRAEPRGRARGRPGAPAAARRRPPGGGRGVGRRPRPPGALRVAARATAPRPIRRRPTAHPSTSVRASPATRPLLDGLTLGARGRRSRGLASVRLVAAGRCSRWRTSASSAALVGTAYGVMILSKVVAARGRPRPRRRELPGVARRERGGPTRGSWPLRRGRARARHHRAVRGRLADLAAARGRRREDRATVAEVAARFAPRRRGCRARRSPS